MADLSCFLAGSEKCRPQVLCVFRIGNTPEGANDGVALIKRGVKTATSSLLWTYEAFNKPLPEVGSLSIVTDMRT